MISLLLLVEAVGERGRGRLVDDALDLEAGDAAGVLGGLALGVVEVRGDGDDRLGDRLAEVVLGGAASASSARAALISGGEYFLPRISIAASPLRRRDDLVRDALDSRRATSSKRRPMKRLIEKTVFSGLVMA